MRLSAGEIYNGDMVEKTVDALTKEVGKHGYPFTQVRPRGDRDPATRTVTIAFVLDEGPRVYIERIDVRGNTRTRDYVIRREFEIGEGDAYNRVLIDRAERRLNNLGYFKKVKITNEPGSTPDRVIVVVDVEDQPTGSLSLSGGYSTTDGFIAEVVGDRNQFHGPRPICAACGLRGPVQPRRRLQLHRALFSRQPDRGRLRCLREEERCLAIFLLQ